MAEPKVSRALEHMHALRISSGLPYCIMFSVTYLWSCYFANINPSWWMILWLSILGISIMSWCMLYDDYYTYWDDIRECKTTGHKRYKPSIAGTHTQQQLRWMSHGCLLVSIAMFWLVLQFDVVLWSLIIVSCGVGYVFIWTNKEYLMSEVFLTFSGGLTLFIISYCVAHSFLLACTFLVFGYGLYQGMCLLADECEAKTSEQTLAKGLGVRFVRPYKTVLTYRFRFVIIGYYMVAAVLFVLPAVAAGYLIESIIMPVVLLVYLLLTVRTTERRERAQKKLRVSYGYIMLIGGSIALFTIYPTIMLSITATYVGVMILYNYATFGGPFHDN